MPLSDTENNNFQNVLEFDFEEPLNANVDDVRDVDQTDRNTASINNWQFAQVSAGERFNRQHGFAAR